MNFKSRTVNSVRNILTGFVGQAVVLGIGFINRMVFIRCLTAEYLGINGLFSNILSMLSLAELGIGTAIVYALYKPLAESDENRIAALMQFYAKTYRLIGIVVGCVGLLLLPFLSQLIGSTPDIHENLYVIYLLYLFNTVVSYFFTYKSSILIADQKNYIITITNSGIVIIQCIFQCAILIVTKNYISYLLCQVIGTIVYNIVISQISDRQYGFIKNKRNEKLDKETKRSLFINVKALVITKISGILVNSTDSIIITALQGIKLTGLNSNYTLLTGTLNGILTVIFSGMTASIGNANAMEEKDNKTNLFYSINLLNFWLYGWCSIAFVILADDIVTVFFGSQYVLPMSIVFIMAVNFYTVGMQNAVWTYYNTMGLFNHGKYIGLLTGALNIFFSIILGKKWGLFGILLATFISRLFTNIWYSPYAVFKYGLQESFKKYFIRYFKFIIVLIVTLVMTFLCTNWINGMGVMQLFLKVFICTLIPNLCFLSCFCRKKEFRIILNKVVWILRK